MTKLGMVIINYNDYKTTKILLNNVKDYDSLDSIVVVDNHSTDNSYKILKKLENLLTKGKFFIVVIVKNL